MSDKSNIYNVSKQQLSKIGGDPSDLVSVFEVKKAQVEKLGGDLTKVNDIYTAELQVLEHIDGGGGGATLQEKSVSITANGTTDVMPDEGYDGMSKVSVDVNVPSTGSLKLAPGTKLAYSKWTEWPNYDFSEVGTDWSYMFYNATNIFTEIDLKGVTNASSTFNSVLRTDSITLHNTDSITKADSAFSTAYIKSIFLDDTNALKSLESGRYMFNSRSIENINNWNKNTTINLSALKDAYHMFGYVKIEDFPILNCSNCTNFDYMFSNSGIVTFNGAYMSSVKTVSNMFVYCHSLVTCFGLQCGSVNNITNLFVGCEKLANISFLTDLGKAFTSAQTLDFNDTDAITQESIAEIVDTVYDMTQRTDGITGTIKFQSAMIVNAIPEEVKTKATSKGWTITY